MNDRSVHLLVGKFPHFVFVDGFHEEGKEDVLNAVANHVSLSLFAQASSIQPCAHVLVYT